MTSGAAAGRYARALLDVGRAERLDLDRIRREISGFAQLLAAHDALMRVFANPAIPAARKRAVLDAVIARSEEPLPIVVRTLHLLAERGRLALLPQIAAGFEQRLLEYRHVVRAEVVTAAPLPPERVAALRESLAQASGCDVQLDTRVDPAIIGGAVTRVGSTVYDGSITRQLEKLEESLLQRAEF